MAVGRLGGWVGGSWLGAQALVVHIAITTPAHTPLPSPHPPTHLAGFANQVVPLYLSEMAPYNYRGGLNML